MQNPIPKLRQTSIISKKPGFCLKIWKLWRAPTTTELNVFYWKFAHVFYMITPTKECSEFFLILFRSWVINKSVKIECIETRSKQNKNNSAYPFCRHDIGKWETCAKFHQEILTCRYFLSSSKFSNFQKKYLVSRKQ